LSRSNPAQLSPALAALFPAGVIGAQLQQPVLLEWLSDVEHRSIRHCSDKRILDFTAGRVCARRALQEFGISAFDLIPAPDRQPLWPPSFVGSITHTQGYSAAVVAPSRQVRSVGVDTERVDALAARLWPQICTPVELKRLHQLAPDERALGAALMFVAKEAFFKCQFPVTGAWIDFDEVGVETGDWTAPSGDFQITPHSAALRGWPALAGRFRRHGEFLTAGLALSRTDPC